MKLSRSVLTVPLLALSLVLTACGGDSDDNPFDAVPADTDGGNADGGNTDGANPDGGTVDGGDTDGAETDTGGTNTEGGASGSDADGETEAVGSTSNVIVATIASDFGSSAINIVSPSDPYSVQTDLNTGVSDTIVRAYEENYYVIRRYESDTLAAYSVTDPTTPLYEVSTNSDSETGVSSNPHDLVFLNAEKAYLMRYGSPLVWIVNPSAADPSGFKIGEIDLSAYSAQGGVPRATRGVIVDDKLYIVMQRLDEDFVPVVNAYLAVIDTATDTEINTNTGELPGIEIPAFNPTSISIDTATDTLYISAVGDYGNLPFGTRPAALTGGLVTVDTTDYSAAVLMDDTEDSGRFDDVEIISATKGYLVTTSDDVSSLDQFNPMTGRFDALGVAGISGVQVKDIAVGPAGNLWVGIGSAEAPKIVVINPEDNSTVTNISTSLDPSNFAFTQ